MAEILFYHLERAKLEQVLPELLERTIQRGWTARIQTSSPESVSKLDALLWTYADESFLPHSACSGDEIPPISIMTDASQETQSEVLFLVHGAELYEPLLSQVVRCVLIFNGQDEAALSQARQVWKSLVGTGHNCTYWRQSPGGKWEKQN